MTEIASSLQGVKVLVVEDEAVLSMILQDFLEELGCVVVGPAQTFDDALSLARGAAIDIALIDVNLQRVEVFPVADILAGRGIPFIFMSGDDDLARKENYAGIPVLQKPFQMREVPICLQSLLNAKR